MDHNKLWEILKEMGIPDYLTCLLKNLYADQEARVRTGHGTIDWFKSGKVYIKAVYCHHAYFNLYTEYIWRGKWQPLQYSCPENPHGERSLVGYSPWGRRVGYDWATTHRVHHARCRADEAQVESRLLGEISITSEVQMTPPLWQRVKRK